MTTSVTNGALKIIDERKSLIILQMFIGQKRKRGLKNRKMIENTETIIKDSSVNVLCYIEGRTDMKRIF